MVCRRQTGTTSQPRNIIEDISLRLAKPIPAIRDQRAKRGIPAKDRRAIRVRRRQAIPVKVQQATLAIRLIRAIRATRVRRKLVIRAIRDLKRQATQGRPVKDRRAIRARKRLAIPVKVQQATLAIRPILVILAIQALRKLVTRAIRAKAQQAIRAYLGQRETRLAV